MDQVKVKSAMQGSEIVRYQTRIMMRRCPYWKKEKKIDLNVFYLEIEKMKEGGELLGNGWRETDTSR